MNIVVGRHGKKTTKMLADKLGIPVYQRFAGRIRNFWRISDRKQLRGYTPELSNTPVTINWGNTMVCSRGEIVYNTPEAIRQSSNKALARQIMGDAGVSIPNTLSAYGGAVDATGKVVRRILNHHAGKGFHMYETGEDIDYDFGQYYYSDFVDKVKEFRVHVGSGEIITMQEKVLAEGVEAPTSDVWNHAGGEFVFKNVKWGQIDLAVAKCAIDAVNSLDLDYGAVDVIVDSEGVPYCVEVNTSPSLTDYSSSRYVIYFKNLLNSEERYVWKEINWDEVTSGAQIVVKADNPDGE